MPEKIDPTCCGSNSPIASVPGEQLSLTAEEVALIQEHRKMCPELGDRHQRPASWPEHHYPTPDKETSDPTPRDSSLDAVADKILTLENQISTLKAACRILKQ